MSARHVDRLMRSIGIAVVAALGALGLGAPGSLFLGALAWLAFLVFVLSGWGYLVVRAAHVEDPDLGLRAALGTAGCLAIAGPLVALGVCSKPALLALIATGFAAFAWRELVAPTPMLRQVPAAARGLRERPFFGALIIVIGLAAVFQIVGNLTDLDRNVYDDDVIYTPMVRRLLDAGDLVEPFSFRRLAAYGGQTVLQAMAAARGTLSNVHLIDKGVMSAIALLVILGHARERGCRPSWTALLMLVLVLMPEISVNTAAHWSGVVLFAALYRTVLRSEWTLVGLVAATACTLRNNFIAIVVVFVLAIFVFRLLQARRAWRDERQVWLRVIVIGLVVIVPWCVASQISSGTFLYPLFGGTWNRELSFRPPSATWIVQLAYVAWACIDTAPIQLVAVLFAVLVVASDQRDGHPLKALFLAATIGLVVIARSMAEAADPGPVWRYCFGFAIPLTAFLAIEAGSDDDRGVSLLPLGRWLVLVALVFQLVLARSTVRERYADLWLEIQNASALGTGGDPDAVREQRRYAAMQAAIPKAAKIAVMLDEPGFLDYRRNTIANLDTVGFASPGTMPMFAGAEPIRAYLVANGYRYVAFIRADHSRRYYRRSYWIWRYFTDDNLFYQMMSAYQLAAVEAFTELATTTTVVYDAGGLVVLDLSTATRTASTRATIGDELARRSSYMADVARREGLSSAWSLSSRGDLEILDGFTPIQFREPGQEGSRRFEINRPSTEQPMHGVPMRGIATRAHLRVRGDTAMRLELRAATLSRATVRPQLTVSFDGDSLAAASPDEQGRYMIDVVVPEGRLTPGWHDVYLVFPGAFDPGGKVRDPRIARLESIEWVAAQ